LAGANLEAFTAGVFTVVAVYFVTTQSGNFGIHPRTDFPD